MLAQQDEALSVGSEDYDAPGNSQSEVQANIKCVSINVCGFYIYTMLTV